MSYTIEFPATDPNRAVKAIEATKAYLGDKFTEVINLFTKAINAGEIENRRQVHLGMAFAGIRGYPVDAIIERYWPTLPAAEA